MIKRRGESQIENLTSNHKSLENKGQMSVQRFETRRVSILALPLGNLGEK
jgi:hypothetical protein